MNFIDSLASYLLWINRLLIDCKIYVEHLGDVQVLFLPRWFDWLRCNKLC